MGSGQARQALHLLREAQGTKDGTHLSRMRIEDREVARVIGVAISKVAGTGELPHTQGVWLLRVEQDTLIANRKQLLELYKLIGEVLADPEA